MTGAMAAMLGPMYVEIAKRGWQQRDEEKERRRKQIEGLQDIYGRLAITSPAPGSPASEEWKALALEAVVKTHAFRVGSNDNNKRRLNVALRKIPAAHDLPPRERYVLGMTLLPHLDVLIDRPNQADKVAQTIQAILTRAQYEAKSKRDAADGQD